MSISVYPNIIVKLRDQSFLRVVTKHLALGKFVWRAINLNIQNTQLKLIACLVLY
ncbi:unnamed protein product [Paramecium primaurelia]|uniref:Uncharacterized protein n=1 Tax=Paramecium primaurelia TaxID=5886 RepID=A0A8S1NAR2_PARPR|nr:unnamed protein product [Paramecium primaurelia]